jgi:hypothetical protein
MSSKYAESSGHQKTLRSTGSAASKPSLSSSDSSRSTNHTRTTEPETLGGGGVLGQNSYENPDRQRNKRGRYDEASSVENDTTPKKKAKAKSPSSKATHSCSGHIIKRRGGGKEKKPPSDDEIAETIKADLETRIVRVEGGFEAVLQRYLTYGFALGS